MKLLIAFFFVTFTISAQEVELKNELQVAPILIENSSINVLENVKFSFEFKNETLLVKKKSYKNIIENILSGKNHLIFQIRRRTKIC